MTDDNTPQNKQPPIVTPPQASGTPPAVPPAAPQAPAPQAPAPQAPAPQAPAPQAPAPQASAPQAPAPQAPAPQAPAPQAPVAPQAPPVAAPAPPMMGAAPAPSLSATPPPAPPKSQEPLPPLSTAPQPATFSADGLKASRPDLPENDYVPPPLEAMGFRNQELLISEKDRRSSRRKKMLVLFSMPFLIALVTVYLIPFLIDWDKQKENLKNQMLSMTGRELTIDGSIEFKALPLPSFTIRGAKLSNPPGASTKHIFTVQSMTAHPSLFALLFGKVRIAELEMNDLVIELENFEDGKPNWDFKANRSVAEVSQGKKTMEEFAGIKHVVVHAGKLFFRSGKRANPSERLLELSNVDIRADSFSGPFNIKGGLDSSVLNYQFEMITGNLTNQGADVDFKLNAATSVIGFKGKVTNWATDPQVEGRLTASLDKSIESMTDYFGIDKTILPSKVSDMLANNTTQVEGNLLVNASGFSVKELSINSISTKGNGEITALFTEDETVLNMKLGFAEINLDEVMEENIGVPADAPLAPALAPPPAPQLSQQQLLQEEMKNMKIEERKAKFDLASTLRLNMDVTVDKATFRGQTISGLKIDAVLGQGETMIRNLTANDLPGNSSLNISGTLSKEKQGEKEIQKFESTVKFSGDELLPVIQWLKIPFPEVKEGMLKSFNLEAGLTILPDKILVHRISAGVDESLILGQALVQKGDNPATTSAFKIKYLNIDRYLLNSLEGKTTFFDKPYQERDVVVEQRSLDEFLRWPTGYFRNFGVSLDIDELVIRGDSFKNISTIVVMKPNIMEVKKLSFDSFNGKTEATGLLSTKNITPYIEVDITSDKFDLRYLTDFSKDAHPPEDPSQPIAWSAENFYLSRLAIANMKVTGKFKEFIISRMPFKDVEFSMKSDGKEMQVDTFRGTLFGGVADAKALVGIDRPNLGISISLNNAEMDDALRALFGFEETKQGRFSLSLGLSSNGTSESEIVSKLAGSGTLTARGWEVKGFDLTQLYQKYRQYQKVEELRQFLSYVMATGSTTIDYLASNIEFRSGTAHFEGAVATHFSVDSIEGQTSIDLSKWEFHTDTKVKMTIVAGQDKMAIYAKADGPLGSAPVEWNTQEFVKAWETNFYRLQ